MNIRGGTIRKVGKDAGHGGGAEKGAVNVKVANKHDGTPVEGATVVVAHKKGVTGAGGEVAINNVRPARHWVSACKAWPSEDHFIFIIHYPKTTISRKAKAEASAPVQVDAGSTAEVRLMLEAYRSLERVILHRNHIHPTGEDKYGHWWTKIDEDSSYGWWPKYNLGDEAAAKGPAPTPPPALSPDASIADKIQHTFSSAAHTARNAMHGLWDNPLTRTFRGVEGDLNGVESFGGRLRRMGHPFDRDPHHNHSGEARFQPVLHDGRKDGDIKEAIRNFALAYTGGWSWRVEFGNHCHTFQKKLLDHCQLREFKDV